MDSESKDLMDIVELKTELSKKNCIDSGEDDFQVEFEVIALDPRVNRIRDELNSIDEKIQENQDKLNKLDKSIERLTNHADGIDYAIAVTSGIITGIIDATIVGEWNFEKAKAKANQDINNKVVEFVKKDPRYIPWCNDPRRSKDPNRLETAIEFLEKHYKLPGDGSYMSGKFGIGGASHRLDDLCHHPTLVGLICCVIVQFTGHTMYVNKYGESISIPISINEYGNFVGKNPVTKMFAGIINWFITCAKTISNRKGHLMSDIATSASLPGGFLSTITELASLPCFRDAEFLTKLRHAYTNGIGAGKNQIDLGAFNVLFEGASNKLDIKTGMAVKNELKRQAMPVVINEVLVRATYFIRHFIAELKAKKEVSLVDWNNVIPFNNRTIVRMMTIASGTFTAVDLADAAIRSAVKSGGFGPEFLRNMILRVNFVGVGRFSVAVGTDIGMGISREFKRNQRMKLYEEQIALTNAKLFYRQADMWIAAEGTREAIKKVYEQVDFTIKFYIESIKDMDENLEKIGSYVPEIEEKNNGLIDDMLEILE